MKNKLDTYNFRQMIIDSPNQFRAGFDIAKDVHIPGFFKSIMISGMGGSALPGNIFRIYLNDLFHKDTPDEQPLAIYQNRSYNLPPEAFKDCLNFICSYSGNTEETIASFEEALKHNLPCIGLSSGGKVEEMCLANDIPHIKLPIPFLGFQPRVGTGYFFGVMFQVLVNLGLIRDTTEELLLEVEKMKQSVPDLEEQGKILSKKLVGKTPVVYATPQYKSVAMVWKIKFNENAKTPAFWNFFPELNHNEMVGWTLPQGKFMILMLRDSDTHPRILKRFEITAELLRSKGTDVEMIDMVGASVFEKIFGTILIADFASYYLALEYGQNPTPVDMVEELKALLVA
ncbi:MAG: bifunctional phosphoglucose/phosphomannose isomerase [Candidatus Moranbacteria bacterium CG_4_10_14_3_um_filter_45_9]|nr:MAG: bifunctional phosphoglucose/phosphomannose isomerase [Candidatus Moranbacteria bacterium CG_4_10_14_3_um_filter_45_9]PJA85557.1 MAG: bifunctional phosphoglucose/phosphomannose isomerase [Candidatus Moranbacteria bacterium CG_4_9_14_3_um_filter_45_14]